MKRFLLMISLILSLGLWTITIAYMQMMKFAIHLNPLCRTPPIAGR